LLHDDDRHDRKRREQQHDVEVALDPGQRGAARERVFARDESDHLRAGWSAGLVQVVAGEAGDGFRPRREVDEVRLAQ
jgi:hypothetical protein